MDVPDGVRGRQIGVRGAEIGWRDRSGARARTVIERKGPEEKGFQGVGEVDAGALFWRDHGLEPDTEYEYRVRAVLGGRESVASTPVLVLTDHTEVVDPVVTVHDPRAVSPGVTVMGVADSEQMSSLSTVMAVDADGNVLWQFESDMELVTETQPYPDGDLLILKGFQMVRLTPGGHLQDWIPTMPVHHDVDILPWGNLVALTASGINTNVPVSVDALGSLPGPRTGEAIIEIDVLARDVVNAIHFDVLVPREDVCIACLGEELFTHADWIHLNAVEYVLEEEALYVSARNLNRIYKLSYPDGEVLWVMGDGGDFGEGLFDHQHNPTILRRPTDLAPGRMLLFDNGLHGDPLAPERSRVIEIEYDPSIPDARIVWEYHGPPAFYSDVMGDASRLPGGNTLVVDTMGQRVLEVDPQGLPVWELTLEPPYYCYKAHRVVGFP